MKKILLVVFVLLSLVVFAALADAASEIANPPSDVSKLLSQLQKQVNEIPKLSVWAQVQYDFDINAGTLTPDMGIWAEYNFAGFDFAAWYYGNTPGPLGGAPSSSSFQYYGSYTLPKMGDFSLSAKMGIFRIRKTLDYLNYWNGTPIYSAGSGSRINYLALDAKIPNLNLIGAVNTTNAGSPLSTYLVGSANFSPVNMVFAAQNNFSKFNIGGQAGFDLFTDYSGAIYAGANIISSSGLQSWVGGGKINLPADMSFTGLYYDGNFPNGGSGILGEFSGSMGSNWSYWADLLWSTDSGYSESQFALSYYATDNLTIQFLIDNMGNDTTGYISYQFSF
jgi:hypothetical protein